MSYFRRTLGQTGQTVHSTPPARTHNREESNVATVQTVSYEKGALSQLPSSLCKDSIIFKCPAVCSLYSSTKRKERNTRTNLSDIGFTKIFRVWNLIQSCEQDRYLTSLTSSVPSRNAINIRLIFYCYCLLQSYQIRTSKCGDISEGSL